MEKLEQFNRRSIYKIMPLIMHQVVFIQKEIQEESGVSINTVSSVLKKLVELNIIQYDTTINKKGYKYARIYDTFIGKE